MSWYGRAIGKEEGGLEGAICDELMEIGLHQAQAPLFDVYMTKPRITPPFDVITIYFPPEALLYCPALLTKYRFSACDEPDLTTLDAFCGVGR